MAMRVLNSDLDLGAIPPDHRKSFLGRPHKVCFLPSVQFFKFTEHPLIDKHDRVSPFWSGVEPLTNLDQGLVQLLERVVGLGVTPQALFRATSAVRWQWNSMTALQITQLTVPAYGFVGQCAHQPWDLEGPMQR